MTKKEKILNALTNIVKDRYAAIGKPVTPEFADSIYFDLLGEYERNGYLSAKYRAVNDKLQ